MVHVVQQVDVGPDRRAHGLEQLGCVAHVLAGVPVVLARQARVGRLIGLRTTRHAVHLVQPRHAALRADRLEARGLVAQHLLNGVFDVAPVGVAIDHHPRTARTAEQLVERHARGLGLEVPQRGVDRRDGAHRHRPAPPVGPAVQVLPDVLDLVRVAADQAGNDMVIEVTRDGQLAAVQRGVAQAGQTLVSLDLQRNEVAAGATNDDAGAGDLHVENPLLCTGIASWVQSATSLFSQERACPNPPPRRHARPPPISTPK